MPWTTEQVMALVPDPSSAKAGRDLASPRKWVTLGGNDTCAWGSIKGSGANPYQTSIDLSAPAFKCSCPSRKFPCKHGLGLFLILAQQSAALTETTAPAWTTEWMAKRAEKQSEKIAKQNAPPAVVDPEAAAKAIAAAEKRELAREQKISAGLDELGVWLGDLVRTGFASLPGKPASFWETPAARLVDAQAPGMARRIRDLDGITTTGEQWPARLLRKLALLHLAREGWSRMAALPPAHQADVQATIGINFNQPEILAQPGVRDQWFVIGQRIEEDERVRTQRTWLLGRQSGRPALCLSFSAGPNQPLDVSLVAGTVVDAELVFFPGAWPLRSLVKERHGPSAFEIPDRQLHTITTATALAGEAFASNPWLERVPFALGQVIPLRHPSGWMVRDEVGHYLPLDISEKQAWKLVSLAGGNPIALAGEWNGETLCPLSVWAEGRFLRV